ncbi:hypothetical protein AHAS_Ahas13G0330000 [Arachis hypogaea]
MHIWKNFFKQYKNKQIKGAVWECAKCTIVVEFKASMEKLKRINKNTWAYLAKFEPAMWVKTYFSYWTKVDNLINNMCEVWNSRIVDYRAKPVLTMCKKLRCYIMRRMTNHKILLGRYKGKIAAVQQKKLEMLKKASDKWQPQ